MTEYRNEWKYICTEWDLEVLRGRIKSVMQVDPNQGSRPFYRIRSLYFDDAVNSAYYDNIEGLDHRKKYRIRIYDDSIAVIHLEIKYKEHGYTKKESCSITEEQCRCLMEGETLPFRDDDPKPLKSMYVAMKTQKLHPVTIVEYERSAYACAAGNVRVTFDRNIAGSNRIREFLNPKIPLMPVMETGRHLLEVKYDELLPSYIAQVLDTGRLEQTAFSKYYICRLRLQNM